MQNTFTEIEKLLEEIKKHSAFIHKIAMIKYINYKENSACENIISKDLQKICEEEYIEAIEAFKEDLEKSLAIFQA